MEDRRDGIMIIVGKMKGYNGHSGVAIACNVSFSFGDAKSNEDLTLFALLYIYKLNSLDYALMYHQTTT